ncbi:DUF397 domain-containing protein [Planomonospora parontospora]|uniref:DUF397 domain-containing protein n=1 Tax=Planomonospora parontospora TaxID=58119 RepID=UPI0016711FDD|nr:DUF397 domain-containing protein [Planomonospora parontospora]GGL42178.1 hypothetical protein GCM10014719_49360 [Planomonospora parontospora subsp. antibiotica]GII18341.1 hypothetical protein Ppa05_50670 [Planomonospora parontospora subsp. antibiotica]
MPMPDLSQVKWRKSLLSGNGQNCVEVGVWRKSSRSGAAQDCVEVTVVDEAPAVAGHKADAERLFLVRDSKDPDGPVLAFTPSEWDAFVDGVKNGEFDDQD